jgi:hypothetical protein
MPERDGEQQEDAERSQESQAIHAAILMAIMDIIQFIDSSPQFQEVCRAEIRQRFTSGLMHRALACCF